MRKQYGLILLEVIISITILGIIMLYMAQMQHDQLKRQSETLTAAKIANLYQLSTQVIFEPLVRGIGSNQNDISTWKVNDTIKSLQRSVTSTPGSSSSSLGDSSIYIDIKAGSSLSIANFFNGSGFIPPMIINNIHIPGPTINSCDPVNGVFNIRVDCNSALLNVHGNIIKGVMISGENESYFSINHVSNTDINQVKPTKVTIFIDGVNNRQQLLEMNNLAEAVSEQVSQIDDMDNSSYAEIHIANFNTTSFEFFDTGVKAHEVLLDPNLYNITNNMGLAIIFELSGTQALRSDGMIAMQENRSLCWNVNAGSGESFICQSAATSNGSSGSGTPSRFIETNGNLLYQTENQATNEKVYRTPIEPIVTSFNTGSPVIISKPVCPRVQGVDLVPHLSIVPSSITNSGYGIYPDVSSSNYGSNVNSETSHYLAKVISGILFTWNDLGNSWEVNSVVGSPNDSNADDGLNLRSVQILALRWCEREM